MFRTSDASEAAARTVHPAIPVFPSVLTDAAGFARRVTGHLVAVCCVMRERVKAEGRARKWPHQGTRGPAAKCALSLGPLPLSPHILTFPRGKTCAQNNHRENRDLCVASSLGPSLLDVQTSIAVLAAPVSAASAIPACTASCPLHRARPPMALVCIPPGLARGSSFGVSAAGRADERTGGDGTCVGPGLSWRNSQRNGAALSIRSGFSVVLPRFAHRSGL